MGRFDSSYVFPNTNFIGGMGSAVNIAGNYFDFKWSPTPAEADLRGLRSDWVTVGDDIWQVMRSQKADAIACQTKK